MSERSCPSTTFSRKRPCETNFVVNTNRRKELPLDPTSVGLLNGKLVKSSPSKMRSKVRPRFHDPPRKDGPIKKLTNNTHNNIQEDATCWGAGYQFRLTFCKDVGITSADAISRMGSEHPTRKWKTPILARLTLHYPSPSGKGMGARSNWSTRNNAVQYKKNFLRRNNDALVSHDKKTIATRIE